MVKQYGHLFTHRLQAQLRHDNRQLLWIGTQPSRVESLGKEGKINTGEVSGWTNTLNWKGKETNEGRGREGFVHRLPRLNIQYNLCLTATNAKKSHGEVSTMKRRLVLVLGSAAHSFSATRTVHRCEIETAADVQRASFWASVQSWISVTHCLHCTSRKCSASTQIERHQAMTIQVTHQGLNIASGS